MSDTPRTDALMRSLDNIGGLKTEVRAIRTAWGQTIDFARRLERERDALRRKLAVANAALDELQQHYAGTVERMREAEAALPRQPHNLSQEDYDNLVRDAISWRIRQP